MLNNGDEIRVSGDIEYGNSSYRVSSNGIIEKTGKRYSMITLDEIDGDKNVFIKVNNKVIHKL